MRKKVFSGVGRRHVGTRVAIALVAGIGLGSALGHYAGSLRWMIAGKYSETVDQSVTEQLKSVEQAEQKPSNEAVIVGDSIARLTWQDRTCGYRVVNFAVRGSSAADWLNSAAMINRSLHPTLVVVALGTNDAQTTGSASLAQWQEQYRRVLAQFPTSHFLLVSPPEVEMAKADAVNFRQGRLAEERQFIQSLASATISIAPTLRFSATVDGVHPDDRGRREWLINLNRGCAAA